MPLAFDSISHGRIAFGFFNIESDMLLLENHFFFADDFCKVISGFSRKGDINISENLTLEGYVIARQEDVGDLMGAISGIHHTGFIGDVYRLFPFPEKPEAFKQNPSGSDNRNRVISVISRYGKGAAIPFYETSEQTIHIGDYLFDTMAFQALINYVWQGGYPRWKDDLRPDYVLDMRNNICRSKNLFFKNFLLDPA